MTEELNLARFQDTDVTVVVPQADTTTPEGEMPSYACSDWIINGVKHNVGDHVGLIVHTTQDSPHPAVAVALRCVVASIRHNGNGVPSVAVHPADAHSRVLHLRNDSQDFYLTPNDKVVVLKSAITDLVKGLTTDEDMTEAALLQAGIDPARRQAYNDTMQLLSMGQLFGGPPPLPLPTSEMLSMEQASFSIYGVEFNMGDHIEVKGKGDEEWGEARIEAIVLNREETEQRSAPCYIVAITDQGSDAYGYLLPDFMVRPTAKQREAAAGKAAAAVNNHGYTTGDIDNVALIDKLLAGVPYAQARMISVMNRHVTPTSFDILGIAHIRNDELEISTNGKDWDLRRINAISYTDNVLTVVVDGACEGDTAIVLSDVWFVRPAEAMRARCLLSKRAQSIPAGAGAQAYAADSGLFKQEAGIDKDLEEGIPVAQMAKFHEETPQWFGLQSLAHHEGEWIEVKSLTSDGWDACRITGIARSLEGMFLITVQRDLGKDMKGTFTLKHDDRIRLTLERRNHVHQSRRSAKGEMGAFESTVARSPIRPGRTWSVPAPVGKPEGGTRAFNKPLFQDAATPQVVDVHESQAYEEIDEGITADRLLGLASFKSAGLGQSLAESFPFFGMDHHPGEYLELFYPHADDVTQGEWKEHRIVSVYRNNGAPFKPAFDITVQKGDDSTMFKMLPINRIRLTHARREALKRQMSEAAQLYASRQVSAARGHAGYEADASGKEFRPAYLDLARPVPGMFAGRAFGDQSHLAAGEALDPMASMRTSEILTKLSAENNKPYTSRELMEHTGMAGLALSSMLRGEVVLGEFREAIKQFATGVETLVLGRPGRGFE